jgi:serine/threonine-protein phosphatase PP1 catalytic subunit
MTYKHFAHGFPVCGFYAECQRRLDIQTWDMFVDVFNCMPIAAIVRSRIFCVHSGLSPLLASMDHIREIQRPTAIPDHGLLHDLLWSEPSDDALGWEDSLGSEVNSRNQLQARRSHFGQAVVDQFLALHDLDLICRGDSPVGEGYAFGCGQSVVTIFSAPSHLNSE